MKTFNAASVALEKKNVIEAGAGTGKTYSIAILVLRLILEKNIPVQEILMVTFTKAAVAELETRIRDFIALAYQYSQSIYIDDKTIQDIVNASVDTLGTEKTQLRLKDALALMDETSILTIHGFCQKTLQEFAFETQQVFGAEALSEEQLDELRTETIQQFWRKYIAPIKTELLEHIHDILKMDLLVKMVKEALSGKRFNIPLAPRFPLLDTAHQDELLELITIAEKEKDDCWKALCDEYINNEVNYRRAILQNTSAKSAFENLTDPNDVISLIVARIESNYISDVFPNIAREVGKLKEKAATLEKTQKKVATIIFAYLTEQIKEELDKKKSDRGLLSFDDMIDNLHQAVCVNAPEELLKAMREKFKAVFIDEFQDTDRKQYEIFHQLFGPPSDTIVFMIGDPKQSIYAWRKADLFTYFKAVKEADNQFNMSTNFRSATSLIAAFNHFFKPVDDFDTFYFEGATDEIVYLPVDAPNPNDKGILAYNGTEVTPISFYREDIDIPTRVAMQVAELLSNPNYRIIKNNQSRAITPADIAILVRTNYESPKIKAALSKYKIPAINKESEKILEKAESKVLLIWLAAIESMKLSDINRAMLSNISGYRLTELSELDQDALVERFRIWHTSWNTNGIYVTLQSVFACFELTRRLLQPDFENGERVLSNFIQLAEILHQTETRLQYRPADLISWLKKATEGNSMNGDEYLQRIESDENAVEIVTIHKSKGLEYNIVLAPYLELSAEINEKGVTTFRDDTGTFLYGTESTFTENQVNLITNQLEQENRRLVYVALTRARYKCCIFTKKLNDCSGTLAYFHDAISNQPSPFIDEVSILPDIQPGFIYRTDARQLAQYKTANSFLLKDTNWQKISYSYLNPDHGVKPTLSEKNSSGGKSAYDQFIFYQLRKGAFTGNLIHYLLEHIDFTNPGSWSNTIQYSLKRMSPGLEETHGEGLLEFLNHLSKLSLPNENETISLAQIHRNHQIAELEFNFPVGEFNTQQLADLSTQDTPFHLQKGKWQGLMNGKIDFIGMLGDKFYIIDWKSNHLGNQVSDYETANLQEAMDSNNYHLQYYIYLSALYKFLTMRLPNFDYDTHIGGVYYLFIRGIRSDADSGIFYRKPSKQALLNFMQILEKK